MIVRYNTRLRRVSPYSPWLKQRNQLNNIKILIK
nr:MAG TPA: NKG2-D type II integral membrane, Graft versus Leukaemia, c-type.35A [Crassvirales sp.]